MRVGQGKNHHPKGEPSPSRRDRTAFLRILLHGCALFALLHLASGCAYSTRVTTPRSSWEQILATEAIDRALAKLDWPQVDGKAVFVEVGPPGDVIDDLYLRRGIEVALANRGAKIVRDAENAQYVLTTLVGAIGLDISGRFFGLMGSTGGLIPFTVPELALYKTTHREGFAKTEIYLLDRDTSEVVHHSGPVEGAAYRLSKTYLFVFDTNKSDTERLE
jgi:hypothetical protein